MRAKLLPAIPACRAPRGTDRYFDLSSWLSLHQTREDGMMMRQRSWHNRRSLLWPSTAGADVAYACSTGY